MTVENVDDGAPIEREEVRAFVSTFPLTERGEPPTERRGFTG